jgi:hypothetical protein
MEVKIRSFGTLLAKMEEIEGAIGRQFHFLSIVCAVNTRLDSLSGLDMCYLKHEQPIFI